jgi:adenylate kinase
MGPLACQGKPPLLEIKATVRYRSLLLLGAPGSGKGTQGKILGSIPGFVHCASGDIFRSLDPKSPAGQLFWHYSTRGELVPDEVTVAIWQEHLRSLIEQGRFDPERDYLVLDGIPRNVRQVQMLSPHVEIHWVFHLSCPDRAVLLERLRDRARKEGRPDDAKEQVILQRLKTYEEETRPILRCFPEERIVHVDATQVPYRVLRQILNRLP